MISKTIVQQMAVTGAVESSADSYHLSCDMNMRVRRLASEVLSYRALDEARTAIMHVPPGTEPSGSVTCRTFPWFAEYIGGLQIGVAQLERVRRERDDARASNAKMALERDAFRAQRDDALKLGCDAAFDAREDVRPRFQRASFEQAVNDVRLAQRDQALNDVRLLRAQRDQALNDATGLRAQLEGVSLKASERGRESAERFKIINDMSAEITGLRKAEVQHRKVINDQAEVIMRRKAEMAQAETIKSYQSGVMRTLAGSDLTPGEQVVICSALEWRDRGERAKRAEQGQLEAENKLAEIAQRIDAMRASMRQ